MGFDIDLRRHRLAPLQASAPGQSGVASYPTRRHASEEREVALASAQGGALRAPPHSYSASKISWTAIAAIRSETKSDLDLIDKANEEDWEFIAINAKYPQP
jgi:hypothetical protein